jgi:hypothetical protein
MAENKEPKKEWLYEMDVKSEFKRSELDFLPPMRNIM